MYSISFLLLLSAQTAPPVSSITLRGTDLPLELVLADLSRQSRVSIRNLHKQKVTLSRLELKGVSFWQALDTIADLSQSQVQLDRNGELILTSRGKDTRLPPTSYSGDFRLQVQRISATRDLNSNQATTTFSIDITWIPTLKPLFLDGQPRKVRLWFDKKQPLDVPEEGRSQVPVDDRYSSSFDLITPAIPRTVERLSALEGTLHAIVPSKWLTFAFEADLSTLQEAAVGGAVRRLVRDEVVCRVDRIVLEPERWSIRLALEYPSGGVVLESFQASSLVVNNELLLQSKDGKQTLTPTHLVIETVSSRRATVTYHFTDRRGAARGSAAQWRLRYTVPARLVEVPIRFRFENLLLP